MNKYILKNHSIVALFFSVLIVVSPVMAMENSSSESQSISESSSIEIPEFDSDDDFFHPERVKNDPVDKIELPAALSQYDFEPVLIYKSDILADLDFTGAGVEIKDQGQTSTCYATSAMSVLNFMMRGKAPIDTVCTINQACDGYFVGPRPINNSAKFLKKIRDSQQKLRLKNDCTINFNEIASAHTFLRQQYCNGIFLNRIYFSHNFSLDTKMDRAIGFDVNFNIFVDFLCKRQSDPVFVDLPSYNIFVFRHDLKSNYIDNKSWEKFIIEKLDAKIPIIIQTVGHNSVIEGIALYQDRFALKMFDSAYGRVWVDASKFMRKVIHVTVVEPLLETEKCTVQILGDEGFFETIFANDVESVRKLLEAGAASVSAISSQGVTPLMIAAEQGNLEMVKLLVTEYGAQVNQLGHKNDTALHFACQAGFGQRAEVVKFLLEAQADPALRNDFGFNAMGQAQQFKQWASLSILSKFAAK